MPPRYTFNLCRRVIYICPSSLDQELLEGYICYLCVFANKQDAWPHVGVHLMMRCKQSLHTSWGNLQGGDMSPGS